MKKTYLLLYLIASTQVASAGIDPEAEKILRQFSDFYRKLDSFQVDCVTTMEQVGETRTIQRIGLVGEVSGPVVEVGPSRFAAKPTVISMFTLAMQRPNKLAHLSYNAGYGYGTTISDGRKLYRYQFRTNELNVTNAPADFDGIFVAVTNGYNRLLPLFEENLLRHDPYGALVDDLQKCEYLGTAKWGDITCHRIRFVEERCDHEMWIETGDKPLLRFVTEGMPKSILAMRRPNMPMPVHETVLSFANWRLNPPLPAEMFQLAPPASVGVTNSGNSCRIEMPPGFGKPSGIQTNGLHQAWIQIVGSPGVSSDSQRHLIYTLKGSGERVTMDAAGKTVSTVALTNLSRNSCFCLARLTGNAEPDLVAFTVDALEAYDATGRQLWRYPVFGVLDVTASDLDGDGFDEVIVGGVGAAGLRVLDRAGKLRWQNAKISTVWHVCTGKTTGIMAAAADGKIHVFHPDGRQRSVIDAGCYVSVVSVARDGILAAGTTDKAGMLVALDANDKQKWSAKLTDQRTIVQAIAVATSQPWVAVLLFGGDVQVYHIETGVRLASFRRADFCGSVAWLETAEPGGPLLLFANAAELWAFRLDIPAITSGKPVNNPIGR